MADGERPSYRRHLLKDGGFSLLMGASLGTLVGGVAGVITNNPEIATQVGLKTGAGVASTAFWVTELGFVRDSATPSERPLLRRLKSLATSIDGLLALGVPAALISGSVDNLWTEGAAALGAISGYLQYQEKFRKQPDLIFPDGTSVTQDTTYSDRNGNMLLPKVYRANSIRDILEFRQANQAQIARWTGILPSYNIDPFQVSVNPSHPVNAIFITDARHFPAGDPTEGRDMALYDRPRVSGGESVVVGPLEHSEFFWPYHPTSFEDGPMIQFNNGKWGRHRETGWESEVVLLAQYQERNALRKGPFSMKEDIVDRYWLIDVKGGAVEARSRRKVAQEKPILIPLPNPSNI